MAGYRRFVAYVYEYQKGRKGRNCGFIRVEAWEERCRMEIHLLCPGLLPGVRCDVFGFVRNAGLMDGSLIGFCRTEESRADCVIETDRNHMGNVGISLDQMGGMVLVTENGAFFGTEWDDQPVRPENFRRMNPAKEADEVQGELRPQRKVPDTEAGEKEKKEKEEIGRKKSEESGRGREEKNGGSPGAQRQERIQGEQKEQKEQGASRSRQKEESADSLKDRGAQETETGERESRRGERSKSEELRDRREEDPGERAELTGEEMEEEKQEKRETPDQKMVRQKRTEEQVRDRKTEAGMELTGEEYREEEEQRAGEMPERKERKKRESQREDFGFGEIYDPFGDGEIMDCRKIQPGDFRYLHPRDCALRNNRFLQYGFYSFGHLLIGRLKTGACILGVPGGYDQQERFMANMFGFPYFKQSGQIQLPQNRGGYWYRLINPPKFH